MLAEAESLCGKSVAVEFVRRQYEQPGSASQVPPQVAAGDSPNSVWEHDAMGLRCCGPVSWPRPRCSFNGHWLFDPSAFWPNYYLAVCAYRLGDYAAALNAAYACVALARAVPSASITAGLHTRSKQPQLALADYQRAIQLDAGLGPAACAASRLARRCRARRRRSRRSPRGSKARRRIRPPPIITWP